MLEKIKEYALVKYAGNQEEAIEFVEGFIKQAMAAPNPSSARGGNTPPGFKNKLIEELGGGLGKGVAGMLFNVGVAGIGTAAKSVMNNNLHTRFLEALEQTIKSNRIIKEADKNKVKQYAETVFKFAPNVATDVNLLSSILANAIHGEGIDPMTIKTLTDLEGRFQENTTFTPKTYI